MNWRKGVFRLLIILLSIAGLIVLLNLAGERTRHVASRWATFLFWFLLVGMAGYFIFRLLMGMSCFLKRVLNGDGGEAGKRKIDLKEEFRRLRSFSTVTASVLMLVFVFLAVYDIEGMGPEYFISSIFSIVVSIISFGLIWVFYEALLFVARGFVGDGLETASGGVSKE